LLSGSWHHPRSAAAAAAALKHSDDDFAKSQPFYFGDIV
jgi:hypothetical protein